MFMVLNEVKLFAIGPSTKALSPIVNGGSMESHGCYLKGKVVKVREVEMARDPKKIHFQIICGKFDVMELDPTTYCLEKLRGFNLNEEVNIESQEKSKVHMGNVEHNCDYAHKLTTKTHPI
jgi:hypothetical protein